ncbi:MAG: Uma2 family endonuclease [Chroococcus sp. CMT-3BRIN-NPC107]|nr:Uma2 family endonuclease [Chroococcus sp. CMT-3BRIN-NPC107]
MTTTIKQLSFAEFLQQYPDGEGIFELVNGEIVQVEAIRAHKNVSRYLVKYFAQESDRLGLNYIVDKDIIIKTSTSDGKEQGRNPDVSLVSEVEWNANVMAYAALIKPIQLAVEVVSTNWEDDYIDKLVEYQRLGIVEYWIVDYLAIASRTYLGYPKVPTVSVYQLIDGEYQVQRFIANTPIISPTFGQLELTTEQIVNASQIYLS